MKKMQENFTIDDLINLVKIIKNPYIWHVTWKTSDGLLHLHSLETFKDITKQEIEPNIKFTIWQEG